MKKLKIYLLIIGLVYTNFSNAQSGWFWQNPLPQGNNLNSVKFVSNSKALACGNYGTILMTTNSGLNWQIIRIDSGYTNTSIFFQNINSGWIASSKNLSSPSLGSKYLLTTNSGINWITKTFPASAYTYSIEFTSIDTGYVAVRNTNNGFIYKTTNNGNNWEQVAAMNKLAFKTYFINNTTGFVCGELGISKTTNGGQNWQNRFQFSSFWGEINSIVFFNDNTGIGVGNRYDITNTYQVILKTTDSGNNWTSLSGIGNYILNDIKISGNLDLFVCGTNVLLKSTNQGLSWSLISAIGNDNLNSLDFFDNNGIVIGDLGTSIKTTNSGINWNYTSSYKFSGYTRSIKFYNKNLGYALCDYDLIKTTNGGINWFVLNTPSPAPLYSLFIVDSNLVYACGGNTSVNCPVIKTMNGGLNWQLQNPNVGNGYSSGIYFTNPQTGYCIGSNKISKTTDSGNNWIQMLQDLGAGTPKSLYFTNDNTGYIAGFDLSYKTTNAGLNWVQIPVNGEDIYFINLYTGFVCGRNMQIRKTTDAGYTWNTKAYSSNGRRFYGIHFFNANIGLAVGDYGALAKTTDGGDSWYYQSSGTDNLLLTVFCADTNEYYIGGVLGTLLKTTNSGNVISITQINQEIPNNFILSQNYPNPFNPQTKIKFDIPANVEVQSSNVKLVIYDLLGREVTTLVNEELKPGTYEADWDGSNYSSGVYFYKIITNDFTETRKMVLMK